MAKVESGKPQTGLQIKAVTIDQVPSLLERVNEQIASLKGDREKRTRIGVDCGPFGVIGNIKDVNVLRAAYAHVTKKIEAVSSYDGVFKAIHPLIKLDAFTENGYTAKQWQEEILAQFGEVTFDDKISRLMAVKEELEKNLSAEHKLQASLNNIADILNM